MVDKNLPNEKLLIPINGDTGGSKPSTLEGGEGSAGGTLEPSPSVPYRAPRKLDYTEAEMNQEYLSLTRQEDTARDTFNSFMADNPNLVEKDGIIYDVSQQRPGVDPPVSEQGQALWNRLNNATQELYDFQDFMKRVGGPVEAYVGSGTDPADAVRKEFMDFLDRAEAAYDLRKDEQQIRQNSMDMSIQQRDMVREGYALPGSNLVSPNFTPSWASQAQKVARTIPEEAPPSYYGGGGGRSLASSMPLSGSNASNPPVNIYGDSDAWSQYDQAIPGFAEGTDVPAAGIDNPDLAWMVGKHIPVNPPQPNMPLLPMDNKNPTLQEEPKEHSPREKLSSTSMLYSRVP